MGTKMSKAERAVLSMEKHTGATVEPMELVSDACCGARANDARGTRNVVVRGYLIADPTEFAGPMEFCRRCAVKLALKILELESL